MCGHAREVEQSLDVLTRQRELLGIKPGIGGDARPCSVEPCVHGADPLAAFATRDRLAAALADAGVTAVVIGG